MLMRRPSQHIFLSALLIWISITRRIKSQPGLQYFRKAALTCEARFGPHKDTRSSSFFFSRSSRSLFTGISLAPVTALSSAGDDFATIQSRHTVAFRPRCSTFFFTAHSVLLRISFHITRPLCPFMVLWAPGNIRSAAPLTTTTRLALKVVLAISSGIISSLPQNLPLSALCPAGVDVSGIFRLESFQTAKVSFIFTLPAVWDWLRTCFH